MIEIARLFWLERFTNTCFGWPDNSRATLCFAATELGNKGSKRAFDADRINGS